MPEDIFISEYDEVSDHNIVIERDDNSLWAYLVTGDTETILLHCLVCTFVEPLEDWTEPIDTGSPPPLIKRFANAYSVLPDLREDQIHIVWEEHQVYLYIDDTLYLLIDIPNRIARSKALSRSGRYGFPLEG